MRATRAAGLAAVWFLGGAAAAPDAPMVIMLTCEGTDVTMQPTGSTTTVTVTPGIDPGIGSAQHRAAVIAATAETSTSSTPNFSPVRVPAHMSIAIEGEAVRIRPPDQSRPGFGQKKSPDGWYPLSDVAINDTQILGRAGYGGMLSGKYRLVVDRLTGDASFGAFVGVCKKAETGPRERKF